MEFINSNDLNSTNNNDELNILNFKHNYKSPKIKQRSIFNNNKLFAYRKASGNVKLLKKLIHKIFIKKYFHDINFYYSQVIEDILTNKSTHVVAEFKDYLIYGDDSEFLHYNYKINESKKYLPKLFKYYQSCSVIFPNYVTLHESKYLYKNIKRKQRIIDEQQEIEDDVNNSKDNKPKEKTDKLFTNSVYDEILNLSESVMRIVFGLKKQKYNTNLKDNINSKNDKMKKNYYDIDNNLNDINDSSEIDDLIKKLNDEEIKSNSMNKEKNKNINIKEKNVENNAKDINISKLKLVLKNMNTNKIYHKNNNVFHTISNHSINISNAFNNSIKALIGNKDNKIININNINNIFITNNEGNINKKIINKNIIDIINKYRNKNNNNNSKILYQKMKSMDSKRSTLIPYKSLYGLNFINKNPLINELININTNNNSNINTKLKNINSRNNKKINIYSIFNSKPSFMNNVTKNYSTIKSNGSNNSNKFINKISKLDFDKLDTINNNILTITNRRKSRNYDKYLKNTSLTISKRKKKKKLNIRNIINPTLSISPLKKKEKNHQMLYIKKKSEQSMNYNRHNINIIANSISEPIKQFPINEYNYIKKRNCENIIKNKGNNSIKTFK